MAKEKKHYKKEVVVRKSSKKLIALILNELPFEPEYLCINLYCPKNCCSSLNLGWRENTRKYTGGHWVKEDNNRNYVGDIGAEKIQHKIENTHLRNISFRASYNRHSPGKAVEALENFKSEYLEMLIKNNYQLNSLELVHSFESEGYDGEDYRPLNKVKFKRQAKELVCEINWGHAYFTKPAEDRRVIEWFNKLTKK